MDLKEALRGKLSKKDFLFAPKAFDSFGNIAVIEIPKELSKKKKLIGTTLMGLHPRFETVCSIESEHRGEFRVQKVKVIAGKKQTIATYKESGCTFLVPLGKVFFSPRLGGERLRIAHEIKSGEVVGCFFSGVGPYPVIFAKNSKMLKAVGLELNPSAHSFAKKNLALNKISNVELVKGDVKKVYKKYRQKFDRIAMPLPHTGYQFLKEALFCIKPKGIIHFYEIVQKGDYNTPIEQIMAAARKAKRNIEILRTAKVREFSPTKEQVVFDLLVSD